MDTEDIINIPDIDFGSLCALHPALNTPDSQPIVNSQLFPNQVQYFPRGNNDFATTAITHGNKWVVLHSATASTQVTDSFKCVHIVIFVLSFSFGKPEALTAFAIVTEEHWHFFVPFNSSARVPAGVPCGENHLFVVEPITHNI